MAAAIPAKAPSLWAFPISVRLEGWPSAPYFDGLSVTLFRRFFLDEFDVLADFWVIFHDLELAALRFFVAGSCVKEPRTCS